MSGGEPFYVTVVIAVLSAIARVYDIISYIPYQLASATFRQRRDRVKAVNVAPGGGPAGPYRDAAHPGELTLSPSRKCLTLDAEFEHVTFKYDKMPCLGTREIFKEESEVQPNGKSFKKVIHFLPSLHQGLFANASTSY